MQFKTKGGSQLKEYCTNLTKEDCRRQSGSFVACDKVCGDSVLHPFSQCVLPHVTFCLLLTTVEQNLLCLIQSLKMMCLSTIMASLTMKLSC